MAGTAAIMFTNTGHIIALAGHADIQLIRKSSMVIITLAPASVSQMMIIDGALAEKQQQMNAAVMTQMNL
jgi:hypothetical protein